MSIPSRVYDDYEKYVSMCRLVNKKPIGMLANENFYDDMKVMFEEKGVSNEQDFFQTFKKKKK